MENYNNRDSLHQDPTINQPPTETTQKNIGIGGSTKPEDQGISKTGQSFLKSGSQFFKNLKTSSKKKTPSIKQLDETKVKKSTSKTISKAFNKTLYKTSKTTAKKADKANNSPASITKHIEYMGKARGEKWDVQYNNQVFIVTIPNPEEGGEASTIKFTMSGDEFTRFEGLGGEGKKQISNNSYTSLIKDILKEDAIPTKVNYKAMVKELNALAETSPKVSVNSKGEYTVTLESNAKNPEEPEFDTHGDIQFSFVYHKETESYEIVTAEGAREPDKLEGSTDKSLSCLLDKVVKSNTNRLDRTNAQQLCSMLVTRLKDENPINVLQALSNLFNNDPLFNGSEKQLDGENDQYSWAESAFPEGVENFTEYITNQVLDGIEEAKVQSGKKEKKIDPTKEQKAVTSKVIKLTSMLHTELGSLRHRKPVKIKAGDGGEYIQTQGHVRVKDGHDSASFDSECGVLSAKLGTSVDPDDTQNMGFVIKENNDGSKEFIVGRTSRTDTPHKVKQNSLMHAQALIESGIAKLTYPPENNGKPTFEFQRTDVSMMDNNLMKAFLAGSKSRLEGKPPESEMAFLESKKSTIDDMWNPDRGNVFQDDKGVYIIHEIEFLENKEDLAPTTYYAKEYKPIFANLSIGTFVDNDACDRIREENIPVFKDLFNSQLSAKDRITLNKHINSITEGIPSKTHDLDKLSEPVQALQAFLSIKDIKLDENAMRNLEIALTGKFLGQPVAPEHQAISMALSLFEVSQAAGLTIGCECKSGNDRTQVFTSLALASKEFQAAHGKSFFFMEASPMERFDFLSTFFDTVPKSGRPNLLAARGPNDANNLNSPPQIKTGTQKVFMKMYNEFEALGKELGKEAEYNKIDKQLTDNLFLKKKVDERLPNVIDQGSSRKIRSQVESAALSIKGAFQESFTKKAISSETITKHLRKLGKAKGEGWFIEHNKDSDTYSVAIPESPQGPINFEFKKNKEGKYQVQGTDIQSSSYSKLVSKYRAQIEGQPVEGKLEDYFESISTTVINTNNEGNIRLNMNENDELEGILVKIPIKKQNRHDKKLLKGLEKPTLTYEVKIDPEKQRFVLEFPDSARPSMVGRNLNALLEKAYTSTEDRLDRSKVPAHIDAIKNIINNSGKKPEVVSATLKELQNSHPFFTEPDSYQFIDYEDSNLKDTIFELLDVEQPEENSNASFSKSLYQNLSIELNTLVKRVPVNIPTGSGERIYTQTQGLVHEDANGNLFFDTSRGPGASETANLYDSEVLPNTGGVSATTTNEEGITKTTTVINRSGRSDSESKIEQKSILEIHNQLVDGSIGEARIDKDGNEYHTFQRVDVSLLDIDKVKSGFTSVYSRARGLPEESELKFLENKNTSYENRWNPNVYSDVHKDAAGRIYVERKVPDPNNPDKQLTIREYKPISTLTVMGSIFESGQIDTIRKKNIDVFKEILTYDMDINSNEDKQTYTHYKVGLDMAFTEIQNGHIDTGIQDLKLTLGMIGKELDSETLNNLLIALTGKFNGESVSDEMLALSTASALHTLSKTMGLSIGCECKSGNDRTQVYVSYAIASHEYIESNGEGFCWATATDDQKFEFLSYYFESMPLSAYSNLAASRGIHDNKGKGEKGRPWIKVDTNVLFHKMRHTYDNIAAAKFNEIELKNETLASKLIIIDQLESKTELDDEALGRARDEATVIREEMYKLDEECKKHDKIMDNLKNSLYFQTSGTGVSKKSIK